MSDLPKEVDCVIIGTGLTNSILAASCARVGKSVLHLDSKTYYGDDWASFTFDQLMEWVSIQQEEEEEGQIEEAPKNDSMFRLSETRKSPIFSNVNVISNECLVQTDADENSQYTIEQLKAKSKLFSIDLNPRLIYSEGAMVELLVQSNIARYHEFKNTVRLVSLIDDRFQILPCKRNEVFTSPILSNLTDKRRLMKFLELCVALDEKNLENSELKDWLSLDIERCLTDRNLGPTLRHLLINSIAMVNQNTPTIEACRSIKKFLLSVERFGKSPFLFPMYGCGELPQSFCRMCAVFGGVYCLNKRVEIFSLKQKEDEQSLLSLELDDGNIVDCKKLVLSCSLAMTSKVITDQDYIHQSRAILIVKRSFFEESAEQMTFFRLPAEHMSNKYPVYLLEVNSSVMICPEGLAIVYLWTTSCKENATSDLLPIVKELTKKKSYHSEDDILWSCYYNKVENVNLNYDQNNGIVVTSLGNSDTDYDSLINEATNTFQKMFPGEDFLPRAPDPDEIVFN